MPWKGNLRLMRLAASLALAALLALAGCGGSSSAQGVPRLSRVVVVVMENHEYGQVIGSSSAPYINSLAKKYALATRYYGLAHPSLPNYLGMLGGSTFGIDSDCIDCRVSGRNLVDQLEGAGLSWRAYMEGMPSPCFGAAESGRYVKRHNPFAYFDDVAHDRSRCANIVPSRSLQRDLRRHRLARFAWITPDLCHDMHDCDVQAGDRYLAKLLPPILRRLGTNGALFLTWDEGESDQGCCQQGGGGRVPMIVAGPAARRGATSAVVYNHYSLLRTIEDGLGLPRLAKADCACTQSMSDLVRSARR